MMLALLTQREAAELLRLSERHLERLRITGTGPKFVRLGNTKAVRYRPADVEAWLASKLVGSTSEETGTRPRRLDQRKHSDEAQPLDAA